MLCLMKLMKEGTPDDCSNKKKLIRDSLLELLATTLFIFSSIMPIMSTGRLLSSEFLSMDVGRLLPIAAAFGISIMVLAYSIGHMSGGHMNPAVSLMLVFKREMSWTKMICYWVCQFTGAMLGAAIAWGGISNTQGQEKVYGDFVIARPPLQLGATTLDPAISAGNGFLLEFMGSFFFYFVIAQTALDKRGISGTNFPAIPIGFSLIVVHLGLIPFTGCGVNPARTFGPSMLNLMAGRDEVVDDWYWIYYVGPFLASLMVAEVTEWMSINVDDEPEPKSEAAPERNYSISVDETMSMSPVRSTQMHDAEG